MTDAAPHTRSGAGRRRALALVLASALVLTCTDLVVKAALERRLSDGSAVDLGVLSLQLGYNTGAAFSLGAGLPSGVTVAVTGLITAGVAVVAWRASASAGRVVLAGLAAVLAGAVANLADRARDGRVTDYLHTGWFPTFNLADVLICLGAATVAVAAMRSGPALPGAGTPVAPRRRHR